MANSVADYILERLTPIYGIPTEQGPDAGSVGELLKRWAAAEGISLSPQALWDRYTLAGAAPNGSIQDKAYDFWSRGLLKSGVRLPGTAGNYLSTPDSVLNSITGDIDIRICLKMDDWTPAATVGVMSKDTSYGIYLLAAGTIQLYIDPADAGPVFWTSTVPVPFVNGAVGWLRFTVDVDNGAGGYDVKFYTSVDGITWTQLGSTVTTAGVISIENSTSAFTLGNAAGSTWMVGTIYYAEVRNGIDGPIAVKFDSSQIQVSGAQLPTVVNGWTWNGTALRKVDDYVRLLGTSGNYLSYPDTPANSVTGDIDIRVKCSLDDWTPAAEVALVAKWNGAGNQRSYMLSVDTAGKLSLRTSADGTSPSVYISSVATGIADGATAWVRSTKSATTGTIAYYTSSDGTTWTALGTTIAGAAAGIFDSTTPMEIGTQGNGTAFFLAGNVYYAEVRNGINGTVVASFDARTVQTPWTINGTGWNWEGTSFQGKPTTALQFTGATGNYVSTPDTAGNSITGDIDIRARVTLNNWNTGADQVLVAKYTTAGNQRAYNMKVDTAGKLGFIASTNGIDFPGSNTTDALGLVAGSTKWLRATRVQSSGIVTFYISDDGLAWTVLPGGGAVSAGTAIFDSTAILEIGSISNGGAQNVAGKVHYAEVRNGIDGPIVASFDATAIARTGVRTPTTTVQPGGTPNLLTPNQASIETDATGWAVNSNCTIARGTVEFLDGIASLAMTSVAAGQMTAINIPTVGANVAVVPGKMYTARASYKAATIARNIQVWINWFTAAGGYISTTSTGGTTPDATGAWTAALPTTAVAPATAAFGGVVLVVDSTGAAGEVHFVDRISLVEAAAVWTMNGSAWDLVAA